MPIAVTRQYRQFNWVPVNASGREAPLEVSSSEASTEAQLNCSCCFVTAAAIGRSELTLLGLLLEAELLALHQLSQLAKDAKLRRLLLLCDLSPSQLKQLAKSALYVQLELITHAQPMS